MVKIDDKAPEISLPADDGTQWSLGRHRGHRFLVVFYPGDDSPVCTAQLCDYRDGVEAFADLNAQVVGISKDDAESHLRFKAKHHLPFVLLTDEDGAVAKRYGAYGLFGTKRAVFLVDENGVVRYAKVEDVALFKRTRDELLQALHVVENSR